MTNARNDFSLDSELDETVGWDEDETDKTLEAEETTDETPDEWQSGYDDEDPELTTGEQDLAERYALRRVAGALDRARGHHRGRVPPAPAGAGRPGRRVDRRLRRRTPRTPWPSSPLLAETAGSEVLDALYQRRDKPDPATYIGRGKVEGLREIVRASGADTVIFDGELAPSQLRNLEDKLKVKVVDRTALILDIFAQHAKSREGQAQVELAQLNYMKQRLRGWGGNLSRQAGGRVGRRRAASAVVAPVRPRSRPTGAGSTPRSPSCAASSHT